MEKARIGNNVSFLVRELLWEWGKNSVELGGETFSVIGLYFSGGVIFFYGEDLPLQKAVLSTGFSLIFLSSFAINLINLSLYFLLWAGPGSSFS